MTTLRPRGAAAVALLIAAACVTALIVVASPSQAATRGWHNVLKWDGGITQACRVPRANDKVDVRVRANNLNGPKVGLTAGMRPIGGKFLYTKTVKRGVISNTITRSFNQRARVLLIIGSNIGIMYERTMKVSDLRRCA